jgi:hypothetical protein
MVAAVLRTATHLLDFRAPAAPRQPRHDRHR